jgi:hypothetical protein
MWLPKSYSFSDARLSQLLDWSQSLKGSLKTITRNASTSQTQLQQLYDQYTHTFNPDFKLGQFKSTELLDK